MKIKAKKAVEAPAGVKAVVQQIVETPLPELASVLRGFKWTFEKGDINHWVPVLDHFDSFFEQHTSNRADVQLKVLGEGGVADPPFPTESCLAVLSTTCLLLENCSNKAAYNSREHVANLLAAPVREVVAAALQTLQVLLRKTHHTSIRWTPPAGLCKRLLAMSKGWGGKEEGLGLVVCTSSDETAVNKVLHKATTLHFEFSPESPAGADSAAAGAQLTTLHISGMDSFPEGEHAILAELVNRYKVPAALRFELLCRIRIAHNFGSLAGRRWLVKQRLMAYSVLLPCGPTAEDHSSLYMAEPDFVTELVALVQAEETVEEEELRTLALRALAHQLQDRSRSSSVITAVTSGGQSGLLSMLLHKSIASILQQAKVPLAQSGSGMLPAGVAAAAAGSSSQAAAASPGVAAAAAPPVGSVQYSVAFVDALLTVVAALVQSTSGCQALNDAGIISALLPLLRDMHQDHVALVCTSLKILEAYMDLSQPASTTFRELGGLTEVIKRLAVEVGALPSTTTTSAAAAADGTNDSDVAMTTAEQPASQQQQLPAATALPAEGLTASAPTKQMPHNRKTLLKFLLRTIALSSYAPTGNLTATRPQDEDAQLLYASLKEMYCRPDEFGGSLFSLAVSVMTDLIHHEPQSFRQLQEAGLPDAFLAATKAGVVPSGDAIVSIPSALVALCLNSTGLRRVRETCVLNVLIDIFVSKKTMRVLTNDTPAILGSGLEELLRFTPSLRSDGVDVVLGVFQALCILGGDADEIAMVSEPLVVGAPVAAESPAVANPAGAESAAANAAGSAGTDASGSAAEAAAPPPQPMDTDAPAAGSAGDAAGAGSPQQPAEAAVPAQPAATPAAQGMELDALAATEAGDAPAVEAAPAAAAQPAGVGAGAAAQAPAPTAAQVAAQRERELERLRQQVEDVRLSALAKRALAERLQQLLTHKPEDADIEVFLPLALTAASRMLEPLLTNVETSRMFVERGGADLLLKLYKLPRLTPVFNFSSASHSLLSVFRALSGSHGAAIASKSKEAVAEQLALLLPQAQELGAVCVPSLAADVRDPYTKQVLVVQGLVALTSAVARNVTAMLPEVSMGDPPLLASMGKLERIVLAQAAASDIWKQARDVEKREAAAAAAAESGSAADAVGAAAPTEVADEAAATSAAAAAGTDAADMEAADEDMEGADADAAVEGATTAEGAAAVSATAGGNSSSSKQKRTPEDTAYDALSYLITSLRTFYMGTAKAIHTPVRRRDEPASAPTVPMKAAALNLALLLVGNLQLRPWQQQQLYTATGTEQQAGTGAAHASSSSSSSKQQLDAAISAIRGRSGHYLRVAEEFHQVLFDSRRHYCHLLVLNYFSALGGMQALATCFSDAAELLWHLMDGQEAEKATQELAGATGDQQMADVQLNNDGAPGASAQTVALGAAVAGTAGTKDPRTVMEAVLVKLLSIYEQLANTSVLLGTPQAANNMLAALPNYAGQPLVPPSTDPVQFVNHLHSNILSAVLPLWSHPKAARAPSGVLTAMIHVLQTCAQGPGNASLVLRYQQQGRPAAPRAQQQPDAQMVQTIVEMGFSQPRAEEALRRVGANSVELAMEWLINHPEEPVAPAAGAAAAAAAAAAGGAGAAAGAAAAAADQAVNEEEELTRALLASLSVVGMSPDAVAQRSQQQPQQPQADTTQPTDASMLGGTESPVVSTAHTGAAVATDGPAEVSPVAAEIITPQATPHPVDAPGAPHLGRHVATAGAGTATAETPPAGPAAGAASSNTVTAASDTGLPAPAQLCDGAVRLVAASPSTAFSISDLLVTMAQREEGKGRDALVARLMDGCLPPAAAANPAASGSSAAAAATAAPPAGADILTSARLLLLLLYKDSPSRRAAAKLGLVGRSLQMLGQWQEQYKANIDTYENVAAQKQIAHAEAAVKKLEVPVWVEALLMLLDLMATTQLRNGTQTTAAARAGGAAARVAAARAAVAAAGRAGGAPAVTAETAPAEPAAATAAAAAGLATPAQPAGATATTATAAPAATAADAPAADTADVKLPAELSQLSGLSSLLASWKPCGLLDDHQQQTATAVCLTLLQQLHSYADKWEQPSTSMFEADGSLPNASAVTQALLQLMAHLTKRHANAHQVLAAGGHRLLLSLPAACLSPTVSRQEANIGAILRNLLEDPLTLESWMESEIKNSMTVKGSARDPYTGRPYPYNQVNPASRCTTVAAFLSMMSSLATRDPAVFLQAVAHTCTLETSRGDTMVRLKTAKEMMSPQQAPRQPTGAVSIPGSRDASAPGTALASQTTAQLSSAADTSQLPETPAAPRTSGAASDAGAVATPKAAATAFAGSDKDKAHLLKSASKPSRKLVPGSFADVIDALLDVVLSYQGAPKVEKKQTDTTQASQQADTGEAAAMELDAAASGGVPVAAHAQPASAAPAAAATASHSSQDVAPLPADVLLRKLTPESREVGIQAMVLRLLTDYCLMFTNSVGLLLKRDSEGVMMGTPGHHHATAQHTPGHQEGRTPGRRSTRGHASSGGGSSATAARGNAPPDPHKAGMVLKHIMRVQLIDRSGVLAGVPAGSSVSIHASSLLQAVCIRSGEGRKRIMNELVATLTSRGSDGGSMQGAGAAHDGAQSHWPYICKPGGPSPVQVAACVRLMGALVQSGGATSRSDPRQPQSSSMPVEVLRAMREAGAVKALTHALQLVSIEHPQAKDAINAILKPLEVLTRPLPKVHAPAEPITAAQLDAAWNYRRTAARNAATAPASTAREGATGSAAAAGASNTAAPGAAAAAAAADQAAGSAAADPAATPAAGAGRSSGESGGRAAMEEDQHRQAGEEAAGPDALAAAGRFVAGGAAQPRHEMPGELIDHLMDQLVDIEVELGADDSEGDEEDSDSDEGDSDSQEGSGSDEDMAEGQQEHMEGAGAAGGEQGGMGDAPSLTEDEDDSGLSGGEPEGDSDDVGDIMVGNAGAAFIDPAAAAAAGANAHGIADLDTTDEEEPSSDEDDEDPEHHHHHHHQQHHDFEDELLAAEEEIHMMQAHMDGQAQEGDGVLDPMDDEEDEEEEEEYLDEQASDEEGWDQDAMAGVLDNMHMPGERPGLDLMTGRDMPMPMFLPMGGNLGRMGGRRMMYRPSTAATAAGVWDDADGDAAQDGMSAGPMSTVQMLLSQLGINASNGAGSVALMGPNGRQFRLSAVAVPGGSDAVAAGQGSDAINGAIHSAMQSLTQQLMPQQHRLLALPPRLPAAESAALLASASSTGAAADDAALRGQASNVNALTRLLTRAPEASAASRLPGGRAPRYLINPPAGLPPFIPPGSFLQSLEMFQPGLLGGPGESGLTRMLAGDNGDTVWDEAVNQLLEALAPPGHVARVVDRHGRALLPGVNGGQAASRAGAGAGEDAGLDPRQLESHMLSLLRSQAPPARQPQEAPAGAAAATGAAAPVPAAEQPAAAQTAAEAGTAAAPATGAVAGASAPAAAGPGPVLPPTLRTTAAAPAAGRRPLTEEAIAAAFQAALADELIQPAVAAQAAAPAPHAAAAAAAVQPIAQPQVGAAAVIASHPVDIPLSADASAPESPTAAAAVSGAAAVDEPAPMDTEDAGQPAAPPTAAAVTAVSTAAGDAMETEGDAEANAGAAGTHDIAMQQALRQAADAAGIDLAFLEALPDELRIEVLSAQGVELQRPQPGGAAEAAPPLPAARAVSAAEPVAPGADAAAADVPAVATSADDAAAPPAAAGGDAAAQSAADEAIAPPAADAAAPVPTAAPATEEEPAIDPEFLAALPEDIREEVLAQQRAEQRARAAAARAAARQGQVEMSLADLLAAMDDDARADALTQLSDSDLAQLPPQLRAQAQALRDRVARQLQAQQAAQQQQAAAQQQQHDFLLQRQLGGLGSMAAPPGSSLVLPMGPDGRPLGPMGLSHYMGNIGARFRGAEARDLAGRYRGELGRAELLEAAVAARAAEEPEGPPIVDESDLAVLVSLLRASLPLSKMHLQKLLLNLAGHSSTREQLLTLLLGLLRGLPGSAAGSEEGQATDADHDMTSSQQGSMDVSEDGKPGQQQWQGLSAALDSLGAATTMRSAAAAGGQALGPVSSAQGKPAIVSRRVLDMLAYLSRHSQPVSRQMLSLRIPATAAQPPDDKGKGKMPAAPSDAPRALEVLLAMLSAPLCERSVSLLEQLMLLLEVVMTMVQRYDAEQRALAELQATHKKHEEQHKRKLGEQQQQPSQPSAEAGQARQQAASNEQPGQQQQQQHPEPRQPASEAQQQEAGAAAAQPEATPFQQEATITDQQQPASGMQQQAQPPGELATSLASIQPSLLQQLPGLLARESLSEPAYVSIAKVIKLVVESTPAQLPLMLSMLVEGAAGVAQALLGSLDAAADKGIDADAQLAPAIGTKSGVVLRMLYALQGFQAEVKEWLKQQQEKEDKEQQGQNTAADAAAMGPSISSQAAMQAGSSSSRAATAATAAGASSSGQAGSSTSAAAVQLPSNLDPAEAAAEVDKAVNSIATRTAPLWKSLSRCILRIEDNLRAVLPQHMQAAGESAGNAAARLLPPGAQQVLPLVEAFFVLCALQDAIPPPPSQAKDLLSAPSLDVTLLSGGGAAAHAAAGGSAAAAGTGARGATPPPSVPSASQLRRFDSVPLQAASAAGSSADGSMPFLRFAERHRRLLNAYIRRNTGLLESSLAPLLRVPKLIDFDNKRAYFRSRVRSVEDRTYAGSLRLAVKRNTVFEDSFNKLRSKTPAEMRSKLSVTFVGEEGIDAGGVSREWYQVMAREIFNPNLALFVSVPEGGTTFQPNPNSIVQSDTGVSHLEFFKFVGRLVGKALYDGQIMDAYFTRSFYKHMLGEPLTYEDIEAVDPEYYKNLKWMLEHDITDVLDLTFTAESDFFGKTEIVELVPGGREIKVTEANKHEYVNLIARHRMTTSIKTQIQAFLEGFWQLVPRELICIFNDHELELLISGLPDIDVSDLRANTEYTGFSPNSPIIQWFWQVVADMDKQDLALLLQFVTGTSKVPLGGFRSLQGISGPQRFQIHKSYGATDRLPSAHTCFNQLDLPEYESKEQLTERLAVAIHEGHEGFGFG